MTIEHAPQPVRPRTTGPRDVRDARRLAELEVVIDGGLASFVAVGEALLEVRESKLYRIGYPTFEAYCKGRWNLGRRRAYQLMEASEVAGVLGDVNHGTQELNERQARELVPVLREQGPEAVAEVWAGVIERAERDETPITGPVIRNAVRAQIRGMAAESESELQEVTANWTDEQREAARPEVMRQRGELMRLVHDLGALPEPTAFARSHSPYLSSDFFAEAMFACGWLEHFCDALEASRE